MFVLDSNIWLFALAGSGTARATISTHRTDERRVRVSAYIFAEVLDNLSAVAGTETTDELRTRFTELVWNTPWIDGPTQAAVERLDLGIERRRASNRALAAAFEIQPKDAPVLSFGYVCSTDGEATTIRTADESFAEFDARGFYDRLAVRYAGS